MFLKHILTDIQVNKRKMELDIGIEAGYLDITIKRE